MKTFPLWQAGLFVNAGDVVQSPLNAYSPGFRSLVQAKTEHLCGVSYGDSGAFVISRWTFLTDEIPAGMFTPLAWSALTPYPAIYRAVNPTTGGWMYRTAAGISGITFDATEEALWTQIPGGHYRKLAAGSVAFVGPVGITKGRFRLTAGGGGGGGGGSAATGIAQVGGGGGGAGGVQDYEIAGLVAGTSYVVSLATTGGLGGTGGAAGGNAGVANANGDGVDASIVGPAAITYTAKGGGKGSSSAANSSTAVQGGCFANPGVTAPLSPAVGYPGCGGLSAGMAIANGPVVGGSGGASSSTTKGGNGGSGRTAPGVNAGPPAGFTATTTGGDGTTALQPGCGGGGGGGGTLLTGAGGSGGAGGAPQLEVWY